MNLPGPPLLLTDWTWDGLPCLGTPPPPQPPQRSPGAAQRTIICHLSLSAAPRPATPRTAILLLTIHALTCPVIPCGLLARQGLVGGYVYNLQYCQHEDKEGLSCQYKLSVLEPGSSGLRAGTVPLNCGHYIGFLTQARPEKLWAPVRRFFRALTL